MKLHDRVTSSSLELVKLHSVGHGTVDVVVVVGHSSMLQLPVSDVGQSLPPNAASDVVLNALLRVPEPQDKEHSLQVLHCPSQSTGHSKVLQVSTSSLGQIAPAAEEFDVGTNARDRLPPPHDIEHVDQPAHSPSQVGGVVVVVVHSQQSQPSDCRSSHVASK